jgi:phosphatidylglycerol lysyltransferase
MSVNRCKDVGVTFLKDLRLALMAAAPLLCAVVALAAGGMLLASAATPSVPHRFVWLMRFEPPLLIELGHFISSLLGLTLVMLAFGLRRRLDVAWMTTLIVLLAAAPLSLVKGYVWEETALLTAAAVIVAPFKAAFPRTARLARIEITPGWLFSAACLLLGVGLLGVWSFQNADYAETPFWRVMADEDAARSLRAWIGAAIGLFALGVWRMFASSAPPVVAGDQDPAFDRVRAILARPDVDRPSSNLALLGDKRFLFSPSGESFLMFGVRGRSWIALGAPVGREDERLELLWRFRELADAHAARPAIYGLEAEDLPDVVELGFAIQKIGECAVLPLADFSVEGRRRGNLRRAWRKAGEEGATFEVVPVGSAAALLPELKRISDAWLEDHAGGEKAFSIGGFSAAYLQEFPIALVRHEGRVIAFASLWTTPSRAAFSIDLMRYTDEGPRHIMDFLFLELLEWGRNEGYAAFDFGTAPLSGLQDRPLAPVMSRVGRLIFDRGEEIYNFQGVRRYKDKYDPIWQPRYVAAARRWAIPLILADVSLLTSGGVSGLAKRPERSGSAGRHAQQVDQVDQH